MTTLNYCDTREEMEQLFDELEQNPDFAYIGHFDMIQDIYFELNEHGFTDEQIDELFKARYGNNIEIIEYNSYYDVFIGAY